MAWTPCNVNLHRNLRASRWSNSTSNNAETGCDSGTNTRVYGFGLLTVGFSARVVMSRLEVAVPATMTQVPVAVLVPPLHPQPSNQTPVNQSLNPPRNS